MSTAFEPHDPTTPPVIWLDEVGSTNDVARDWIATGAQHGCSVAANKQHGGRGRRGTPWLCPPHQGLAFSVLLRPTFPKALWPRLSLVAGLAVLEELQTQGLAAQIKWPNDIWIRDKKICGILIETCQDWVIVGIGLNVSVTDFPVELRDSATSLALEGVTMLDRAPWLLAIRQRLLELTALAENEFPALLASLRRHCALSHRRVRLRVNDAVMEGVVLGIGNAGELRFWHNDRELSILQADEVRPLSAVLS